MTDPGRTAGIRNGTWGTLMSFLRRIAPALLLVVLAPVTAEFLLGDFTVRSLGLLIVFIPPAAAHC